MPQLLIILLLFLSLAALGGHNLRLRRERHQLQNDVRRLLDAGSNREAELERELVWHRTAATLTPAAILVTDHDTNVLYANAAAHRFFGNIRRGDALIACTREHHFEELAEQATTLGGTSLLSVVIDLPERQVQTYVSHWTTPAYPRGGTVFYLRDVTELNRLTRARRDMIGNISHELRTPLASIKLVTGTLLDGAIDESPMNRKLVSRVATENEALIRLVEDLTALNYIETGRTHIQLEKVNLRQIVEQRLQRLTPQMELKGVKYYVSGLDEAMVDLDPERFGQVLTNIFDNAIKFSPPNTKITATLYRKDNATLLDITDEGPGIPPHDLPRIFERFYKGDRSRTRTGGGTGLGLAIARHMVEAHGGTITAQNNDISGATFTITLPD